MQKQLEQALPRAYVAAYRWLGNRDESRDACQDAAARALAAAARYNPSQPFYPWFYSILRNLCMDRLKRRGRAVQVLEQVSHLGTGSQTTSPEGQVLEGERARALSRAINNLSEELREVIEMRHFQDLGYEEMALIIGCPVGTVMSRLYRARRELCLAMALLGGDQETGEGALAPAHRSSR